MGDMSPPTTHQPEPDTHLEFEAVRGFFLQSESGTEWGTFDLMSQNFGLIDQEYDTDASLPDNGRKLTQWQRFAHKVKTLNEQAPPATSYRVLYLGRHGQGYHNVGESFYGTPAWNCYYSALDADPHCPEVVFSDAHLTKLGIQQARTIAQFWSQLITEQSIPTPEVFYVSPLSRAIQTANHTFGNLFSPSSSVSTTQNLESSSAAQAAIQAAARYEPIVKELLRENHGIHTCDRRPSKTYLQTTFPDLTFPSEDNFTELDELYSATYGEPDTAHTLRMACLLQDILSSCLVTYISMTSHSGSIAALLRAVNHREFGLPTGGAIPVLLRVEEKPGKPRPFDQSDRTGWRVKPDCKADPLKAGLKGYKDIGEYVRDLEKGL